MKKIILVLSIILLALIFSIIFVLLGKRPDLQNVSKQTNTKQPVKEILSSSLSKDWTTYISTESGFTIKLPEELKHDKTSEGERFYMAGLTQSKDTEMQDGILLIINSGKLNTKSFKTWVDQKYTQIINDPTEPRIGGKIPINVAGIQGIAFTVSSLGERINIYLPKGGSEYLEIINATAEPKESNKSYQKIVDTILSTIKYIE